MPIYVSTLDEAPLSGYRQEYEADSLEEAEGICRDFSKAYWTICLPSPVWKRKDEAGDIIEEA